MEYNTKEGGLRGPGENNVFETLSNICEEEQRGLEKRGRGVMNFAQACVRVLIIYIYIYIY